MDPAVESEDDSQVSCTSLNVCFRMEFCEFSLLHIYMYMGHVCSEKLDRVLPVCIPKMYTCSREILCLYTTIVM